MPLIEFKGNTYFKHADGRLSLVMNPEEVKRCRELIGEEMENKNEENNPET